MNKKNIAREFLIFFSLIILTGLLYAGMAVYYYSLKKELFKENQKSIQYTALIDSLNTNSSRILVNNYVFEFLRKNDLTTKTSSEFLKTYCKPDSSKIIYEFFKQNNLTDLSEKNFYLKYLNQPDVERVLLISEQIDISKLNLKNSELKQQFLKTKILTKPAVARTMLTFICLVFIIVYPFRILYLTLIWSIKTIRQSRET